MSFRENPDGWGVNREESIRIVERAIDLGINFFDTANIYGDGESESILGDALSGYNRDWPVVATKIHPTLGPNAKENPNGAGLTRKAIEQELTNSLDRLGMDAVDLYQIHRCDPKTPIDVTLRVLNDIVSRGQAHAIGATSTLTYEFAEALYTSDRLNLERFATMQNRYNLVYREEEREMLPFCDQKDVGVIPWSPLAGGYLARSDNHASETSRGGDTDWDHERRGGGRRINERVAELAEEKGVTMAQIALAWQLHKDMITAPIVGVSSIDHLEQAAEAVSISLSSKDLNYLEEPYEPKRVKPIFVGPSDGHYR